MSTGLCAAGDRIENEACARKRLDNLCMRGQKLLEARSLLAGSCELEPLKAAFWHDLGVIHRQPGDQEKVSTQFRTVLLKKPRGCRRPALS